MFDFVRGSTRILGLAKLGKWFRKNKIKNEFLKRLTSSSSYDPAHFKLTIGCSDLDVAPKKRLKIKFRNRAFHTER